MTDMTVALHLTGDNSGLVGSVQVSRAELDKLTQSAANLNQAGAQMSQSLSASSSALNGLKTFASGATAEFNSFANAGKTAFNLLKEGFESAKQSIEGFKGVLAGIGLALEAKDIIESALAMDRLNGLFTQATGSASAAAEQLEIVRRTADALGQPFISSAQAYGQLLAEVKGTPLAGQAATNIFIAFTEAIAANKLSATQATEVYQDMLRMFAKGADASEQLRVGIGVHLPGAFQILAQAFGVSEIQFQQLISQGRILAGDVANKLPAAFDQAFRGSAVASASSAQAAFNRLGNAFDELKEEFANAGFMDAITQAVRGLNSTFSDPAFQQGVRTFGKVIGDAFAYLVTNADTILKVLGMMWAVSQGAALGGAVGGALGGGRGAALGSIFGGLGGALGAYIAGNAINGAPGSLGSALRPFANTGDGSAAHPIDVPTRPEPKPLQDFDANYQATIEPPRRAGLLLEQLQNQYAQLRTQTVNAPLGFYDQLKSQADAKTQQQVLQNKIVNPGEIDDLTKLNRAIELQNADLKITQEVLTSTGASQGDYAERIKIINDLYAEGELTVDQYQTAVIQANEKMLASHRDFASGVELGFLRVHDASTNYASQAEKVVTNAFSSMESAVAKFATTGKFDFDSFATGILQDIVKMQVQANISGPLSGLLSQFFKGGSTTPAANSNAGAGTGDVNIDAAAGHTGAVIGGPIVMTRNVHPSVFAGAPRFHGGGTLGPDEVPFIGKKGEVVGWPAQMAAAFGGGGTDVHIHDERGANAPPVETSTSKGANGRDQIRVIIRDSVRENIGGGSMDGVNRSTYGLARRPSVMRG